MVLCIDHTGKGVLVTGGGSGIGAEIAVWFARAGARVAVHDIDQKKVDFVVARICDEFGDRRAFGLVANARDDTALLSMVDEAAERLQGLDIAVNNIGSFGEFSPAPLLELSAEHWRGLVNQNLIITALAGAAQAKHMVERGAGGVILNVSSGETTRPSPSMAAYGAAKAGVNHLTQTMAVELGGHGVRVIAIAPGTTLTERVREALSDELVEAIIASSPLQRATDLDELARLSVFLASDYARCITGQLILADAGAHLSRSRPANRRANG